ncbi:MAG: hypothetical protein ACK4OO_04960 [bacterium]
MIDRQCDALHPIRTLPSSSSIFNVPPFRPYLQEEERLSLPTGKVFSYFFFSHSPE